MFSRKTAPVRLTNTLTGEKEELRTLKPGVATLYTCGPTVYGPAHIGNLRAYVFSDTLARTLKEAGYKVKRVINITDVGHLVGDGDEGEDKMKVGAEREQTTPEAIADRYAKKFVDDIRALNIDAGRIDFPRATGYIREQVAMIRALEKKGFTYRTEDGVYFDTAKFPGYGALGNVKGMELQAGARVAMGGKKNPHDFALWRSAKPNDLQKWPSPWGEGNPGWSIECSAMATSLLGPRIDIHTGGEDHIQVHHNNEIAQSECATGKAPFAKVWMHNAFMSVDGQKISKSLGNTYSLEDLAEKRVSPLALRYLFLQAHYRTPLSFTWQALSAAGEAHARLTRQARALRAVAKKAAPSEAADTLSTIMRDDLATPAALAYLHEALKDEALSAAEKLGAIEAAERHFGLCLLSEEAPVPAEVRALADAREEARKNKDFKAADEYRIHIEARGYRVEDGPSGPVLTKVI